MSEDKDNRCSRCGKVGTMVSVEIPGHKPTAPLCHDCCRSVWRKARELVKARPVTVEDK